MNHTSPISPSPTFEYRHTAVWTPLGGLVATGFLLGCALTAKSVGQAILLLLATGVFGWAASLFYEAVKLRIDQVAGEITWERQSIRSFRLAHVERTYPLSALSAVWLEQTRSSNYHVRAESPVRSRVGVAREGQGRGWIAPLAPSPCQ